MLWHGETCGNKGEFSRYFLPTPITDWAKIFTGLLFSIEVAIHEVWALDNTVYRNGFKHKFIVMQCMFGPSPLLILLLLILCRLDSTPYFVKRVPKHARSQHVTISWSRVRIGECREDPGDRTGLWLESSLANNMSLSWQSGQAPWPRIQAQQSVCLLQFLRIKK